MRDTLAIMPARGGSKRLPRKNTLEICGLPMFVYTAFNVLDCGYVSELIVSTESVDIIELCLRHKLSYFKRNPSLSNDETPKHAVIVDYLENVGTLKPYVMSVQPNSPEITPADLVRIRNFFDRYVFPESPIREVVTVNSDLVQNGAVRLMTTTAAKQRLLSSYLGVYVTDYIDIHTQTDYLGVKLKLEKERARDL